VECLPERALTERFEVEFWGTRGSIPSPGPDTVRYGGNTSCVEIRAGGQTLIFDAGTGIRPLGIDLQRRGVKNLHLLMSHYHWDHIMGLPFFACLFDPSVALTLHGENRGELNIEQVLAGQMVEPYFPVPWDALAAQIEPQPFAAGDSFRIGDVTVRTCPLHHPQSAVAFRVEWDGRSVVYATDLEHGSHLDRSFTEFIAGADMLIMDCSFQDSEFSNHVGWGHSTWQAGIRFATAGDVGQLVLFHHLPQRTDDEVAAIAEAAALLRPGTVAAAERMVLPVRSVSTAKRRTGS